MPAKMNINDNVWVRLTEAGMRRWRQSFRDDGCEKFFEGAVKSHTEETGHIRFQIHDLMSTFGSLTVMGAPVGTLPFEDNEILLEKPEVQGTCKTNELPHAWCVFCRDWKKLENKA